MGAQPRGPGSRLPEHGDRRGDRARVRHHRRARLGRFRPGRTATSSVWTTELAVRLGDDGVAMDLRHWVNQGLMTLFFLVVGLDAKRERDIGELRERRRLTLPALAAVGGAVVPVLIYLAVPRAARGPVAGARWCRRHSPRPGGARPRRPRGYEAAVTLLAFAVVATAPRQWRGPVAGAVGVGVCSPCSSRGSIRSSPDWPWAWRRPRSRLPGRSSSR